MPARPRLLIGQVMHRRLRPVVNAFTYPVFFVQLPVADLAAGNGRIFSVDRNNLLSFHQKDHGPRDGSPLLPWIQALLRRHGLPDDGEIILQCFPRVFGFVFNPVSFWFCHNRDGELIAVLAEVSNTFGGRHSYLLHNPDGTPLREGQTVHGEQGVPRLAVLRGRGRLPLPLLCRAQVSGRPYRLRRRRRRAAADLDFRQVRSLVTTCPARRLPAHAAADRRHRRSASTGRPSSSGSRVCPSSARTRPVIINPFRNRPK